MRILLDTNIFIPIEPASAADVARNTPACLELVRLCNLVGHQTLIHPLVSSDLARDRDRGRADLRESLLGRYQKLEHVIPIPAGWSEIIGSAEERSNDWVDHHLLSAVAADAVHVLVSEDIKLRKKARRLNLHSRVWSLAEALEAFRVLTDQPIDPLPNLELVKLFKIDDADPILESLRNDYGAEPFAAWLAKSKREGRDALIIRSAHGDQFIAGLVILKLEDGVPGVRGGKTLKLCTFKVGDQYGKNRYGELLLKGVFDYAAANGYDLIYFTAFENKAELLGFSESFGFRQGPTRTALNELVAYKDLRPTNADYGALSPWEFHVRFGPWMGKLDVAPAFIIPIQPRFYSLLFPEGIPQQSLFPLKPCGNGIKKAYLCHAQSQQIRNGDTLYFYNSVGGTESAISAIGIAEDILRTSDDSLIIRFVGNRTVYTNHQINELCTKSVLAIRFRRIRILKRPLIRSEIVRSGIINGPPQSITQIPKDKVRTMADLCRE